MNHKRSKNPPEFPSFYGPSSYRPVFTQPGPAFVNTTGPDVKIDCDYYIPKKFQNIRSPPPNPNPPKRVTKKLDLIRNLIRNQLILNQIIYQIFHQVDQMLFLYHIALLKEYII